MSKTIIAVFVNILATALPYLGLEIGNEELTTTVQTIVLIVSGVVIYFERFKRGDVSPLGVRK